MIQTLFLEELLEKALKKAEKQGVEDFSGRGIRETSTIIRFSNNNVTVNNYLDTCKVLIYLGYKGRRITANFENIKEEELIRNLSRIIEKAEKLEPYRHYVSLPRGRVEYEAIPGLYDSELSEIGDKAIDIAEGAINSALDEGAKRISGSLSIKVGKKVLLTSGNRKGEYRYSQIYLNVRAFANEEISGQWNGISTSLRNLNYEEIGRKAGELATKTREHELVKPGKYDVLFSPTVMANFLNALAIETSAFYVDMGLSAFIDKIGTEVANNKLTVMDDPLMEGNPGGKPFDDEGTPTKKVKIIEKGVLKTFLHNSFTARRYNAELTGHAGIIVPMAHSLIVEAGNIAEDEALKALKEGLYITN
ncbi:hypothetical protein DRN86_04060, partial [Candidatus Geothermarchaeota archaeon]